MLTYAGIGSTKTPQDILTAFTAIATCLAKRGYTLRSGGAPGADTAFEKGCDAVGGKKEIYLPWKGFNDNHSELHKPTDRAVEVASEFHPAWKWLRHGAKKLHARNSHQVLGLPMNDPVDFIVCWTKKRGGTMQALRIAEAYDIRVFNFYHRSYSLAEMLDEVERGEE